MTLIAFVFPKLQTPKLWLDKSLKSLTGPLDKHHGRCAKALLKSASQLLYHIHWVLRSQLSRKRSLLLTWNILGLVVNTLAADEKYPVLIRGSFTIPIQMQLPEKQKMFHQFLAAFSKSLLNFKYSEKKDDLHRFWISETTDSENVVR